MTVRLVGPLCAIALILAGAPTSARASERMALDLREATNDGAAGPVSTQAALSAGERFVVTVSGTGSIWPSSQWAGPPGPCGAPESAPLHPGAGERGLVGLDAETVFAVPPRWPEALRLRCTSTLIPFHMLDHYVGGGFQVDVGAGFGHPEPVDGSHAVPRADHTYTYELIGQGRPAAFRYADTPTSDNVGALVITIWARGQCAEVICQPPVQPPGGQPSVPQSAVAPSVAINLPTARTCRSRRRFVIHIRLPRGVRAAQTSVKLGSRSFKVRRGRSSVTLRGLPRGRFTIAIRVVTTRGQVLRQYRRYRTCAPKSRSQR